MADSDQAAANVLAIMQEWQWLRCDPDGVPFHPGWDLNIAVNHLAMEGVRRPQDAILDLLCKGDLLARGAYRWQKYEDFETFHIEAGSDPIKPRHWECLAKSIREGAQGCGSGSAIETTFQLEQLGLNDCSAYDWEFASCRFSYAYATDTLAPWDEGYMEEWFSAWDIEVWPRDYGQELPDDDFQRATAAADKGGRPAAADWELAALELAGRYYRGDFKPKTRADVKRELAGYLTEQDVHPADSTIGNHAKLIFEAFEAWEQD